MKLIIAIVQNDDVSDLVDALRDNNYMSTKLASTGGFLSAGNTTLLIGIEKEKVDDVLKIIGEICKTRKKITTSMPPTACCTVGAYVPQTIEVKVGGAVVFVTDVDRFEKL